MSNVVSAAVISGELIIGLDSGEIIRCGYVQGPPGLKGDQGPQGATGPAGVDGNTLHTVEGTPDGSLGRDGDYAINRVEWRIHGPKAGGRWPQGVDMLAKGKGKKLGEKGSAGFGVTGGGGGGGGSGPGGDVFTNQVIASGTGRLVELPVVGSTRVDVQYPGSPNGIIPPSGRLGYQSSINGFFVDALDQLDMAMPVPTTDDPPTADIYEGKLWFDTEEDELTLYIYYGGNWVPAAPPVSLDGIETAIANIDASLTQVNANIALNKKDIDDLRLDIQEGDFRPNLEQVLEQGNIADKNIFLTNAEDDLIDLSVTERRIVMGAVGEEAVPKFELRHKYGEDTSLGAIEIDEGGTRLDFEAEGKIDNMHFRFQNDDKLILNKTGDAVFTGKVRAQPGAEGNELVTYDQIASLAGEIDEIKDEKEKGEWKAELPSTGSEGGREVLVNAETFPEAQGGSNMMQLKETGGDDGFGQLGILIDPGAQDAENQALQLWLKNAAAECTSDPDAFKDKYSFFCPQAEELGFAVRNQPIHSIEDPSLTTFKIKFYGKPNTPEKEESIVGVEFFQEGAEGHRPASGKFYMEAYQDKATQEAACQDAYTNCLTGDPSNDSNCLRDLDTCMLEAADGFKPVSDFGEATAVIFHKTDCKQPAVTHSFDEVRIGDSINITDRATGHFIVAEIDAIQEIGEHIRFTIDTVSHSGGIIADNKCVVEFYNFDLTPNGPDLENYVKKAGDTMTGRLNIYRDSGDYGLIIKGAPDSNPSKNMFIVKTASNGTILWIDQKDAGMGQGWQPTIDTHIAHKGYVDTQIKKSASPANFSWKVIISTRDPDPGEMCTAFSMLSKGNAIKISHTDFEGNSFFKRYDEVFHDSALNTPLITIWDKTEAGYRHKHTTTVRSMRADSNGNFLIEVGDGVGAKNHNLGDGVQHWVTIGGFF